MSDDTVEQDRIEENLRQTRSRLDGHLNELQEKIAPGQVFNDLLDYVRGHGGQEFGSNLIASAQRNPLPAVVAGVGLAWLIAANFRGPADAYGEQSGSAYNGDLERRVRQAESEVRRSPGEADDSYQDRLNEIRGSVLGVARHAQESAAAFAQRVQDGLGGAAQGVSRGTHDLRDQAGRAAGQLSGVAAQGVSQLTQAAGTAQAGGARMFAALVDSPVALGALGLAAGALLGLLVPHSSTEDEALGDVADTTRATARDLAQGVVDKGAEVVKATMGQARESAAAKGFTSDRSIEELTGDVASGKVVQDAAALAREVLQTGGKALRKPSAKGTSS